MSAPRRPQGPSRSELPALLPALLVLSVLALAAVARSPAFPRSFLYAFAGAALLRLILGRDGRRLLPRRVLVALALALSASSVAFLFDRLARGSTESLTALLAVVSVFQGLCLLGRQSTFAAFLLILLSSVHAAGAAIEHKDTAALVFIVGYVVVLAWVLLVFERRVSLERETDAEGTVRRLRADTPVVLPRGPLLRAVTALVLLGFPLGVLLYLAAPRTLTFIDLDAVRGGTREAESAEADVDMPAPFEGRGGAIVTTGPGKGVPFGSVAEIKKDITAWFEVWEERRPGGLREVVLRDNVQDFFDAETSDWDETLSVATRERRYRDIEDGRLDGWIDLGRGGAAGPDARTLRIELKLGGQHRLYLQPEARRVQLLRQGRAQSGFEVIETGNLTFRVAFALQAGDQILEQFVPQPSDDRRLVGRRSDSAVSPSVGYLQVPDLCRGPLQARAEAVVGAERDPWRRARLLEAWLQSEAFTYTLKLPRLDPRNPIVDFVENTRSSSCEGFAIALTMMLRTLGHPTRYARGFWGGDRQEARGSVILRGLHYHAWAEMYLDGVGWVPLNPTPPDRRPVDADTYTVASGEAAAEEDGPPFSFLGFDEAQWSRFWARIGRALKTWVLEPLAVLFSGRGGYVGYPLVALGFLLLVRRRQVRHVRRQVVAAGRKLPAGPYGRALVLLGRKGMRRRPSQTARAFGLVARKRFPDASPALGVLTHVHEQERYGGGATAEARLEASRALRDLRGALRRKQSSSS